MHWEMKMFWVRTFLIVLVGLALLRNNSNLSLNSGKDICIFLSLAVCSALLACSGFDYELTKHKIEDKKPSQLSTKIFLVSVNYGLSIKDMINTGRFGKVDQFMNPSNFFAPQGKRSREVREVDIAVVHIDKPVTEIQAREEMRKLNLKPADLPTLLALAAKYPELQEQYPIIALGSRALDKDNGEVYPIVSVYRHFTPILFDLNNLSSGVRALGKVSATRTLPRWTRFAAVPNN